jgi:adenylosuccinate lyase
MTSSDVLDTGLALAMVQSGTLLVAAQAELTQALKARALEHRDTLCVGRTHGVHAEPTTFGLRLAGFALESRRNEERLGRAHEQIAYGKLSGAVGTYAMLDPAIEAEVMDELGLKCEPIATQVIPRDRHAEVVTQMAVAASSLERLAVEIRHLQRTEVREAEEAFGEGQKGSSAMPHKRNPILTENLTGLARLVRSAVVPAMENVALWHERDISHSSVERGIGPDATIHLDFALHRLAGVVERLNVYPANMEKNLNLLGGLVHSQRVMLALTQAGVSREDAYAAVQENAMKVWRGEGRFLDFLKADARVTLPASQLEALFDLGYHTKHVDTVFARVFGPA